MSFSVRLTSDLVMVEAGATVPVSVEVVNKGSEVDRYELQVEGIDTEWTAIPEAVFVIDPGETHSEKIFIKVPRTSESQAGNYPFVVRVRSLNSGDARTAQGVVQVKPFHYLTMEISPKKGMFSPMRKQNTFTVTVLNLGNTEHTLQLFGSDPEEACAYEFESEQINVAPGQQKAVELEVVPSTRAFFSSSRLHGFSISGRSVEAPNVMTSAQGQLEQRPFVTPAALAFLIFMVLIIASWIALFPKAPQIALQLSKRTVMRGETIKVTWQAQNAATVQILADGQQLVAEGVVNGETEYIADKTGTVVFTAKAIRDQRESEPDSETLTVEEPPETPKPIVTLKAQKRNIELGDSVVLSYTITNGQSAYLEPGPLTLPLDRKSIEVTPSKEGANEYEIIVTGKDGQTASAKVVINVADKARVVILAFDTKPGKLGVGGGYVTINWQVSNAARVEISGGPETIVPEDPNASGSQEFMIDKTTTFTIKAIDANGKFVTRNIKVEVELPVDPPVDPGVAPPGTTTGGFN